MKLMAANETKESSISIVDDEARVRESLSRLRGSSLVINSGHASENEQTGAMMSGAVAFLNKPFSDESLLKAVREPIARGRASFDLRPEMPGDQVCPLCHDSARVAEIPGRLMREHADLHASTVEMIKTLNAEWVEQDGLCQRCWRFYVGVERVLNFLRSPQANPEVNRESNPTAGVRRKE